jgi:hypothetical protein
MIKKIECIDKAVSQFDSARFHEMVFAELKIADSFFIDIAHLTTHFISSITNIDFYVYLKQIYIHLHFTIFNNHLLLEQLNKSVVAGTVKYFIYSILGGKFE